MTLYHFTAPIETHLGSILKAGQINVTESNLSRQVAHAGPDVVWLTDTPDPDGGHEWVLGSTLKLGARLTVEVDAHHWPTWAAEHGCEPLAYAALAASGGDPNTWWVIERPIRSVDIVALDIWGDERLGLAEAHIDGAELRRLFQSRGRQRALGLPTAVPRKRVNVVGTPAAVSTWRLP